MNYFILFDLTSLYVCYIDKTAKLMSIICGPNIFGTPFDKISRETSRELGHSTPKGKKIEYHFEPKTKARKKKSPKKKIKPQYPCATTSTINTINITVHIYNSGIELKTNVQTGNRSKSKSLKV